MRRVGPVLANLAAAALPIVTLPIIARLYPPDAYGAYAAFLAAATLTCFLGTLRLDIAFVAERDDRAAGVLAAVLASAVVVAALVWAIAPDHVSPRRFGVSAAAAALFVALVGAMVLSQATLLRAGATAAVAWLNLAFQASFFVGAALLSFAPAPITGNGVIDARALALAAAIGVFAFLAACAGVRPPRPNKARAAEILGRHADTLRFTYPYTIVGMLSADMILFALILRGETALAGAYGLMRTVLLAAGSVFGTAVSPLYFRFALSADARSLAEATRGLAMAVGPAGFFVFGVAAGAAEPLVGLAFGPAWAASAELFALLAFPFAWTLLTGWPERIFEVRGRQATGFLLHLFWAFAGGAALALSAFAAAEPRVSVIAFAAATCLFQIVYAGVAFRLAGASQGWFARLALLAAGAFAAGYGASRLIGLALSGAAHVGVVVTLVVVAAAVAARPLLASLAPLGGPVGVGTKASTE
jgi:O-antigen/teichoic acid export membrane protein